MCSLLVVISWCAEEQYVSFRISGSSSSVNFYIATDECYKTKGYVLIKASCK